MNMLLHTIALEPARWTPSRVSRTLLELLPRIAEIGFHEVEVYEPHLTGDAVSGEIRDAFASAKLAPVILSSYLNSNPDKTSDDAFDSKVEEMARRVDFYGFKKIRLFPGPGVDPTDAATVAVVRERIGRLAERIPGPEILLETHDGSLADDFGMIVRLVETLAEPRIGLLFQPTFFADVEKTRQQFQIEKAFIRHVHLQNRFADISFSKLSEGVVPWPEIFSELDASVGATLEFVPVGICGVEAFDLEAALREARSEGDYARSLMK